MLASTLKASFVEAERDLWVSVGRQLYWGPTMDQGPGLYTR